LCAPAFGNPDKPRILHIVVTNRTERFLFCLSAIEGREGRGSELRARLNKQIRDVTIESTMRWVCVCMSAKDLPQLRGTVSEKRADHKYRNKCSLGAVKRINFELRPPSLLENG